MLAKRLPSILPPMTFEETIETTKLHSIAGIMPPNTSLIHTRPFRAPHHTVSAAGLSGGGNIPNLVKSHWLTMVFCSWMNCPSFPKMLWKYCASLWKTVP